MTAHLIVVGTLVITAVGIPQMHAQIAPELKRKLGDMS
jgi:hypothetical protein